VLVCRWSGQRGSNPHSQLGRQSDSDSSHLIPKCEAGCNDEKIVENKRKIEGQEQEAELPSKSNKPQEIPPDSTLSRQGTAEEFDDLQAVIDAWSDLPDAVKAGIVAMVEVASGD